MDHSAGDLWGKPQTRHALIEGSSIDFGHLMWLKNRIRDCVTMTKVLCRQSPQQKANFSVAATPSFVALTGSGNNLYDHWGRR